MTSNRTTFMYMFDEQDNAVPVRSNTLPLQPPVPPRPLIPAGCRYPASAPQPDRLAELRQFLNSKEK